MDTAGCYNIYNEIMTDGCLQILFDIYLYLYIRFVDKSLSYTILEDTDMHSIEEERDLNAEEDAESIREIEWYMQNFPNNVRCVDKTE